MLFNKKNKQENTRSLILTSPKTSFWYNEAYKGIRTNIDSMIREQKKQSLFSEDQEERRGNIIMITSSVPAEGKTNVSINLACAYAKANKKTLLIDCDLRKCTIQKYLKGQTTIGLSNIDKYQWNPYHCIKTVKNLGFDVLPAGPSTDNPAELLDNPKMVDMLIELAKYYDCIICDTPPVNPVSDASIIAQYVDGVVLVVSHNKVPKDQVLAAKRQLDQVHANIIGVVLNMYNIKNDTEKNAYYSNNYSYSYGYGYGYGYGHEKQEVIQNNDTVFEEE